MFPDAGDRRNLGRLSMAVVRGFLTADIDIWESTLSIALLPLRSWCASAI